MAFEKRPLLKTDLKTLYLAEVRETAVVVFDSNISHWKRTLCSIVRDIKEPNYRWIFSFLGPLQEVKLLPILRHLVAPPYDYGYFLTESHHPVRGEPPGYAELSVDCDDHNFEALIYNGDVDFGFDLYVGAWFVPINAVPECLRREKFQSGRYVADERFVKYALCTNFNSDAVQLTAIDAQNFEELADQVEKSWADTF